MAADPLWGVGCGWAFQSGEWLAQELAEALDGPHSHARLDAAIERYGKRHRRELLGHYLITSDYATGRRLNALERVLWSAAASDQTAGNMAHAFGSRTIGPTDAEYLRLMGRAMRLRLTGRTRPAAERPDGAHAAGSPLPAGVAGTRITVDGVTVPLSAAGSPESSEAIVFVHGNPGSRRDWDDLLSRVAPFARALAPDMPGFGRADKPADYRWHYLARIWRTPLAGEAFQATTTRSGLRTALRHGNPRGLPTAFVDRMYDDLDAGTRRAVLRLYRATDDPGAMGRAHADALRPLDRPALVVWGAHDPYIPVAMAARQRDAFPSAEVAVLQDSGHWPHADDPDAVGRLVEPFLRRVVGSTATAE
jgi:pimeloyl-ACP methyl ester carboxylesterase